MATDRDRNNEGGHRNRICWRKAVNYDAFAAARAKNDVDAISESGLRATPSLRIPSSIDLVD